MTVRTIAPITLPNDNNPPAICSITLYARDRWCAARSCPDGVASAKRPHWPASATLAVRHKKLAIYAREGVPHAWLLDPVQRTLEVLRLEHQHWVIVSVHAADEDVRAEPFEATLLSLRRLWVD